MRMSDDCFLDAVAGVNVAVDDAKAERCSIYTFDMHHEVATFVMEKALTIGNQVLEVADLGRVNGGIVDLGYTASGECVPNVAGGGIGSADGIFCAARPLWFESRPSGGNTLSFAQESPLIISMTGKGSSS